MANKFSSTLLDSIKKASEDVQDSFSRNIVLIKKAQKTVENQSSGYNRLYSNPNRNQQIKNEVQKATIKAVVHYINKQDEEEIEESNVNISVGDLRIRIKKEDFDTHYKDIKNYEIDNVIWRQEGDIVPKGFSETTHYDIYLKQQD